MTDERIRFHRGAGLQAGQLTGLKPDATKIRWRRALRSVTAIAMATLVMACESSDNPTTPTTTTTTTTTTVPAAADIFTAADGTRFAVETVATNLEVPWGMAFAPDGRLFFTERPARVRILAGGQLFTALTLNDVYAQGEAGVLGLTLHPSFATNGLVYFVYTARLDAQQVIRNRLVRYREVNNTLAERAVLFENFAAADIHDGSRVRFGPDSMLYVTMGDAATTSLAQDLASPNGKILRLTDTGGTPSGNPFNSPVWSYGHRNPQGIDWHPVTGELWETEHGPTGDDEVNRIIVGRNYGWPDITGTQTRAGMETPLLVFNPSIAPSGASFYTGSAIPNFRNNLFFATLQGRHLHRVRFNPTNQTQILATERLLEGRYGRLRDVITGPDGALYFSTSNRDGRGTPAANDDRILRIVPVP